MEPNQFIDIAQRVQTHLETLKHIGGRTETAEKDKDG